MLNKDYYSTLLRKFPISNDCDMIMRLTEKMIFYNYLSKNVGFSFPQFYDINELVNSLFEQLSKKIFINHSGYTDFYVDDKLNYSVGDKLKKKGEKSKTYLISEVVRNKYYLKKLNDKSNTVIIASLDSLNKHYIITSQRIINISLFKYADYFNDISDHKSLPTSFSQKIVFIASKSTWGSLKNKDSIPSVFLPNSQSEELESIYSTALVDCITYVTPKYAVCYEEILKKGINVDTIIVCDSDMDSISQIIADQSKFKFKLIIISHINYINNNIYWWNWKKEELDSFKKKAFLSTALIDDYSLFFLKYVDDVDKNTELRVQTNNKKTKEETQNKKLDIIINHLNDCLEHVENMEIPIELKNYGFFIRSAFNTIQNKQFIYLLTQLEKNQELERNEGGYTDFGDLNPKDALFDLINFLKVANPKLNTIRNIQVKENQLLYIAAENKDINLLNKKKKQNVNIITYSEIKRKIREGDSDNIQIAFYSFKGQKDFDFIYNLPCYIKLILYSPEIELYKRKLKNYKIQLEKELNSESRRTISGIEYYSDVLYSSDISSKDKPIEKDIPNLKQIIARLEQLSNNPEYEYKNESKLAIDDKVKYRIIFSNESDIIIEGNDTVFNHRGSLIKSSTLKTKDKVRIYPKNELADNLLKVAIDIEPDIFGEIGNQSKSWHNIIQALVVFFNDRDILYQELKNYGLKVLPVTFDAYCNGLRKFPKSDSYLIAICTLADDALESKNHMIDLYPKIKKARRLYNSTMIALGLGIKQEMQQFLKNGKVGEILLKKNFTHDVLSRFVEDYMPLLEIISIEELSDEK